MRDLTRSVQTSVSARVRELNRGFDLMYGRPIEPLSSEARGSAIRLIAPGLAMIAVTYGLARYAYGLFVPQLREQFDLPASALGAIAAGSYLGYGAAITIALVFTARVGPRRMVVAAGLLAIAGMVVIATAPSGWVLAAGVLAAGSSAGLASPPMAEAVACRIVPARQGRANAWINSGTSIGVAVSGPAALIAAGQWRLAWAVFAVLGVAVLTWNVLILRSPGSSRQAQQAAEPRMPTLSLGYLAGRRSAVLFTAAGGVGFASAVYWTFSRDLVVQAGELSQAGSTMFWTVIGVCGLAGGAAGDLVGRFGIGATLRGSLLAMAGAIATLAVAPDSLVLSYASAALFGASYIMLTGVILLWSVTVFPERPSAGLGAGFLLIAAGQAAGAPVAGGLAGATSMPAAFIAFAGLAVLLATIRPSRQDPRRS